MGKLIIECGNIVDDRFLNKVDAVVNPTNPMMKYGGGVCGAIFDKAGIKELEDYTEKTFGISSDMLSNNLMDVAEVRVTPGFKMPCDIMFAQGPRVWQHNDYCEAEKLLLLTYKNVLKVAEQKGYRSILLPSLGTGIYGFEHEKVAKPVVELLKRELQNLDLNVVFVLREANIAFLYQLSDKNAQI